MSSYSFFVCVINIQFLPGIAAVITHRLGNSNGKHTAQQKVLVLRHKQAFSITLFRKSSRLCCKSLSFNKSYKCLSIFVRGEDHSWTYWEIISVTSLRQTRSPLPGVAHWTDVQASHSCDSSWSQYVKCEKYLTCYCHQLQQKSELWIYHILKRSFCFLKEWILLKAIHTNCKYSVGHL